ncbi:PREDICTED: proline-rich protein 36-like [Trachymyrmex septentrionalis]|uniref:proline-rich protein 36-like n=1 Tax=Trachymyrmex septentrionalis TaxID=34720 RepID=UPI00084F74F0|nr:PREDICTED: proline-rich protein 36-like [Trachymyrmex septentrionalis]
MRGDYPADRLPRVWTRSTAIVANTNDHDRSGQHWVAFYIDEGQERILIAMACRPWIQDSSYDFDETPPRWLRSRIYREARRLLDEEYKRYLGKSRPAEDRLPPLSSSSPPAPPANQAKVIPPPPRTPSPPQLPPSSPPRSPSPAFSDALTERIFPDTPPQSSESSHPISPRRSPSPTNSTDSVEFLEEILPPPPRSYFRILESDTFESLIFQFPRITTASIPQGAYIIGPHYFDPEEIRNAITGQASTSSIPVFLPNSTHAILVPASITRPPPWRSWVDSGPARRVTSVRDPVNQPPKDSDRSSAGSPEPATGGALHEHQMMIDDIKNSRKRRRSPSPENLHQAKRAALPFASFIPLIPEIVRGPIPGQKD